MKFELNKHILYIVLAVFHIIITLLLWFNILPRYIYTLIGLSYLLIFPGFFITTILKLRKIYLFQLWSIRIGLSISYIMILSLVINWLLPFFAITTPLSFPYLLPSFCIGNSILLIASYFCSDSEIEFPSPPSKFIDLLVIGISSLFPILTILGAISLNNGGSNILTMSFLALAGITIIIAPFIYIKLSRGTLVWYLFMLGSATLLMFSLRSIYISGFDISREYFLFQLTKLVSHWDIARFRDAYNACMSITILPTVFSHFTKLRDEQIYKLLFPILFALVPVNIFFITKKFTNDIVALLAALFFISHPWFIDPMVTLARQEIGFLFFTLLILTIFSEDFSFTKKTILYIIFAFSLVISHYSTTYIAVGILSSGFLGTILFRVLVKLLQKTPLKKFLHRHHFDTWVREPIFINGWYVLILIIFTYVWLSQITGATNNIGNFIKKSLENIYSTSTKDSRSGIVNQVLYNDNKINLDTYSAYYQQRTSAYALRNDIYRYPPDTYTDYRMVPQTQKSLPISSPRIYNYTNTLYKSLIIGIQVFFLIGCFSCFFFLRDKFKLDYIILLIACASILAAITFLPYVSQEYNFDRLYLQTMAVMSMFAIIGGMSLLYFISKFIKIQIFIIPITMIVLMYWYSFGFLWQIVGGKTVLWLNNYGYHYDIIYTHKGEVMAGAWLQTKYNKKLVYTHATGRNILSAYTTIFTFNSDVLPSTIDQNSYVYLTRANVEDKINYFFLRGLHLGYNYPYQFLEDNKNKVYSNRVSEIYK